jgi:hypothetical protein
MKTILQFFFLASTLFLSGCSRDPSIAQVKITDATYQYQKELKERADLVAFEKLLGDCEPAAATNADFSYVLEIQTPSKKEYWNYNADGSCVLLRDGKPAAFFRIKNPEGFNQLIGLKKGP